MEPSLPTVRALAIAGHQVVGGVGTHETALPTPERVALRGRCVLPGFSDSHVHFPTWSLAQRQVRLEGTATLEEAGGRDRGGGPGGAARGLAGRAGLGGRGRGPPRAATKGTAHAPHRR